MRKLKTASMDNELMLWQGGSRYIIGLDEAGRGAWAGPVAAGAVCLPVNDPDLQKKLAGVRDSKEMTPRQRARLVEVIKDTAITWGIGWATNDEIDQLNILRATCLAMQRALDDAKQRVQNFTPDYILTDSIKWDELTQMGIPFQSMVRGDKLSLTISSASVIAKVWRDEYMRELDKQYPQYFFSAHKGYGTAKHSAALQAHKASPHHRKTFAPVRGAGD
jgi:ribonuclease HII